MGDIQMCFSVVIFTLVFCLTPCSADYKRPDDVEKSVCQHCPDSRKCYQVPSGRMHWCCMCPIGEYKKEDCNATNVEHDPKKTHCTPCERGTYMDKENNATACYPSLQSCQDLHHTTLKSGNSTQNNKCVCEKGTYSLSGDPEKDGGCKLHFRCPTGFGVIREGNSTHDTVCEPCKYDTFSDEESATSQCKQFKKCELNEIKTFNGSSQKDVECTSSNRTDIFTTEATQVHETTSSSTECNCPEDHWWLVFIGIVSTIVVQIVWLRFCGSCFCQRFYRERRNCCSEANDGNSDQSMNRLSNSEDQSNSDGNSDQSMNRQPGDDEDQSNLELVRLLPESSNGAPNQNEGEVPNGSTDTRDNQRSDERSPSSETTGEQSISRQTNRESEPSGNIPLNASPAIVEDPDPKEQREREFKCQLNRKFEEKGFRVDYSAVTVQDDYSLLSVLAWIVSNKLGNPHSPTRLRETLKISEELVDESDSILQATCNTFNIKIIIKGNKREFSPQNPTDSSDTIFLGRFQPENKGECHVLLEKLESTADQPVSDIRVESVQNSASLQNQDVLASPDIKRNEQEAKSKVLRPKIHRRYTQMECEKIFADKGYKIIYDPPPDGNCQFAAFAKHIRSDPVSVRRRAVQYMKDNHGEFTQFCDENWKLYLTKMSKNEYGDNLTLQALWLHFEVKIVVLQVPSMIRFEIPPDGTQENIVYLGHLDENNGKHYVLLQPKNDSDEQIHFDEIFTRREDQSKLGKLPNQLIREQLKSWEKGKEILLELYEDNNTAVVLDFIRFCYKGVTETTLGDIRKDYRDDEKEKRRKYLEAVVVNEGRDLTAKSVLLNAGSFTQKIIYDKLCSSFINSLESEKNRQNFQTTKV